MGWTAPRTFVAGEIITASILNTHIRDNLLEVIQRDGSIPLTSDWDAGAFEIRAETLESDVTTGTAPLTIASTTVVTNLNADQVDGQERVININADHTHQTTGAQAGKLDHGLALDGLTDDDHTQYQKESLLTTAGDIPYATAASTWARLGIGTALQYLRTNAGATAPEWTTPSLLSTKMVAETRVDDAASGDVAYSGYGFEPRALVVFGFSPASTHPLSWGLADVNEAEYCIYDDSTTGTAITNQLIHLMDNGVGQSAVLKTLDADGFTLTWTKGGSPAGLTDTFIVLALA